MLGPKRFRVLAGSALAAAALAVPVAVASGQSPDATASAGPIKHVLLISVDGLHQSDLNWYAANHPGSELRKLDNLAPVYPHAQTSDPSASDPVRPAIN